MHLTVGWLPQGHYPAADAVRRCRDRPSEAPPWSAQHFPYRPFRDAARPSKAGSGFPRWRRRAERRRAARRPAVPRRRGRSASPQGACDGCGHGFKDGGDECHPDCRLDRPEAHRRKKSPRREGIPWLPGNQGSNKDVPWVWAIKRCPRPASPCSGCQADVGNRPDTLRVAPGGLRERLTFRRWRVDRPLGGGLARQPALRIESRNGTAQHRSRTVERPTETATGSSRRCSYWITIHSALTHHTARPQTTICCHSSRPAILCRLPPTCAKSRIDRRCQRHACVDFNQGQS